MIPRICGQFPGEPGLGSPSVFPTTVPQENLQGSVAQVFYKMDDIRLTEPAVSKE